MATRKLSGPKCIISPMSEQTTPVHISILLDRSGSMSAIADDVVGGFNTFLDEQREGPGDARITLAQFDGQDPFEVLIDGEDLGSVNNLDGSQYLPRGATPLYDAVGRLIAKTDGEVVSRADQGLPIEDQVVVIITDGFENDSKEFTGQMVLDLIEARKGRAWTFVFLGADEKGIENSAMIGVAANSSAVWDASEDGTGAMFDKLSRETGKFRSLGRAGRSTMSEKFFDEDDPSSSKSG